MSQTLLNTDNSSALPNISQNQYLELKTQMNKVYLGMQLTPLPTTYSV